MTHDPEDVILDSALALPHSERPAFLDHACANDPRLRHLVEGLLLAHEHALAPRGAQGGPAPGPTLPVSLEKPGDHIGRYKLLQQIGEGGWGVVYMAEQEEPVRRRVALKVIKPGMDTKQVLARFEAERQALALMDHPNIAKVRDGGATDNGRPYFVMELVRGIKITDYCDQHQLPTAKRLELFVSVCKAIQHAYQKGIIHRDIKPSNILVALHDGVAVPKVIDFGIAKATEQRLTDKTLFTALNQFIGTPAYMSPEQVEMTGLDIDTRSDIYSLGVLLYELLTSHTPFDAREISAVGPDGFRRLIREKNPLKPSTRLRTLSAAEQTTIARARQLDPPKLIHLVRGDLDWIVMKCLEKDRTRRYETANGLAFDVLRYLHNEPVLARPVSAAYRLRKLVARNKLVFASAAAITASLLLGSIVSFSLYIKERQDRQRAIASEKAKTQEAARALAAEADAKEKLRASYLAQARAGRWSRRMGRRFDGLEALKQAAQIRPSPELRNEAIACLALPDLRLAKTWECLTAPGAPVGFDFEHQRYARSDAHGNISVRRIRDDQEVCLLPGQGSPASTELKFSPDGQFLNAAYSNDTCRVWSLDAPRQIFSRTSFFCRCSEFASDSRSLILTELKYPPQNQAIGGRPESGPFSGLLHFYDLTNGRETSQISVPDLPYAVRLNRAATQIAVSYTGSPTLQIMEVPSGRIDQEFSLPAVAYGIDWHPNDQWLAAGCADSRIYLWDLLNRSNRVVFAGHQQDVIAVQFTSDGNWIATTGYDSTFKLWDTLTAQQVLSTRLLRGFLKSADDQWWGHWPDGRTKLGVWQLAREHELRLLRNAQNPDETAVDAKFSPDGALLAIAYSDGVRLIHVSSARSLAFLPIGLTYELRFQPDAGTLLTCTAAGLQTWPLAFDRDRHSVEVGQPATVGATVPVLQASVGRNHQLAYVQNRKVHLRDLITGQEKEPLAATFPFTRMIMSPDAKLVVAWGRPINEFQVWDTATGKILKSFPGQGGGFAQFSPDARWLALGDQDGYRSFEVGAWLPLFSFTGQSSPVVRALAASPDGRMLAVSHSETVVQLLDAYSGQELATLESPDPQPVIWLGFTPDGTHLAVLCNRFVTQLWDLRLIRSELAAMNLDWDVPPYPPQSQASSQPASR
jgi:serine/threonine protein kinase/WD40 repeat protein